MSVTEDERVLAEALAMTDETRAELMDANSYGGGDDSVTSERDAYTGALEILADAVRQHLASPPPPLARQRVTSRSGLHGMLEGAGYSPVLGIWTAEVLWDGDCRLTSVPISGIEPEYTTEGNK